MADNSADLSIILRDAKGLFDELTTYYGELTARAHPDHYNRRLVEFSYSRRLNELDKDILTDSKDFLFTRSRLEAELDRPAIEVADGFRLRALTASFIESAAVLAEKRGEYHALKNIVDIVKPASGSLSSDGMTHSAEALNQGQIFEKLNIPDYRQQWFKEEILGPALDQFSERRKAAQMEQAQAAWKIRPALLDDIEPRIVQINNGSREAEDLAQQNYDQARDLYENTLIKGERARRVEILLEILRNPPAPVIQPAPQDTLSVVIPPRDEITVAPLKPDPVVQPETNQQDTTVPDTSASGTSAAAEATDNENPVDPPASVLVSLPDGELPDSTYNEKVLATPAPADYKEILQRLKDLQANGQPVTVKTILDEFGKAHDREPDEFGILRDRGLYSSDIAGGVQEQIMGLFGVSLNQTVDLNNAVELRGLGRVAWIYHEYSGQFTDEKGEGGIKAALNHMIRNPAAHPVDEPLNEAMKALGLGALTDAAQQNTQTAENSGAAGADPGDGLFTLDDLGRTALVAGAAGAAIYGIKKYRDSRIPEDVAKNIAREVKKELKQKHANRARIWNELRNARVTEERLQLLPAPATTQDAAERAALQEKMAQNIADLEADNKKMAKELREETQKLTEQKEAEYRANRGAKAAPVDARVEPTFKRGAQDSPSKAPTTEPRTAYEQDLAKT
jgi:hypothetical protein